MRRWTLIPSLHRAANSGQYLATFTAIDQHESDERGHRLGVGEDIANGGFGPWRSAGFVGPVAPQIDHHLAVNVSEAPSLLPSRVQVVGADAARAAQRRG
jgi:hypothetical protein